MSAEGKDRVLRIGVAGMSIESGTFSPHLTRYQDFRARRGVELLRQRHPYLFSLAGRPPVEQSEHSVLLEYSLYDLTGGLEPCTAVRRLEVVGLLHFGALPGGMVTHDAYQRMKREIIDAVQQYQAGDQAEAEERGQQPATEAQKQSTETPFDGFFFDVHGAMTVEGVDDAEYDLFCGIRAVLPVATLTTCCQDLHGNLTLDLFRALHLVTTYRTAPHVDVFSSRQRALTLLLRLFAQLAAKDEEKASGSVEVEVEESKALLYKGYVGIPVLVSGEMSSTEYEPGKTIWAQVAEEVDEKGSTTTRKRGIWDASQWVGYAWADEPRSQACAVVIGRCRSLVTRTVESLAKRYWEARSRFRFITDSGRADECIKRALAGGRFPTFLSDAGDNPTAGAAGDCVQSLATLLSILGQPRHSASSAIFAAVVDPAAIQQMKAVYSPSSFSSSSSPSFSSSSSPSFSSSSSPSFSSVTLSLGGKLDAVHSQPIEVSGTVYAMRTESDGSEDGVLRSGNVFIIISDRRRPYHLRTDYLGLQLDPLMHHLVVVKIGYLEPELKAMAQDHLLMLTEGGVPPDVSTLTYHRLRHPIYPQFPSSFDWSPSAHVFPVL